MYFLWQHLDHMTISHFKKKPIFSNKMAVKMVSFWFFLLFAIISVNAEGEFAILHKPDSLRFSGHSEVKETSLKEVFSAALGLSIEEHVSWSGLYIQNPFATPEAAVEVYVDGVSTLGDFGGKAKSYPMLVDEYEPDTFEHVRDRIRMRFNGASRLVNIRVSDRNEIQSYSEVFGQIVLPKQQPLELQHLKNDVEEDVEFLKELGTLNAIADAVRNLKPDNNIDFFYLRFSSLHALSDYHGPSSPATKEAKQLLSSALVELSSAFRAAYEGSVLVSVVCTDVAHTRRTARAAPDSDVPQPVAGYSDDVDDAIYPAIFNIILWFSVVMIFTLVAIVYAVMDMDPGRDSVIYRMTSTRMKKDN